MRLEMPLGMRRGLRGARHFLEGFLPGWIVGAEAPVGLPLGLPEVEIVLHLLEHSGIADRIVRARTRLARRFWPEASVQVFRPTDLRLAAVVYNLLALGHPALARLDARPGGAEDAACFTASLLLRLDPPRTLLDVLSAHTLVGRLFAAERNDSQVSTWLGISTYRGRPVPPKMTRFRRLRRVRVHGQRVEGTALLETPDQVELLDRLLLRSPLTDLLHPDRARPRFHLAGLARWLAEPELCRAILYRWVQASAPAEVGEALARALHVRARAEAEGQEITLVAHALHHLHLLLLIEATHRGEPEVVAADLPGRWKARTGSLFPALLLALRARGTRAGLPEESRLDEVLARRLEAFDPVARTVIEAADRERAETIVAAMQRSPQRLRPLPAPLPRRRLLFDGVE